MHAFTVRGNFGCGLVFSTILALSACGGGGGGGGGSSTGPSTDASGSVSAPVSPVSDGSAPPPAVTVSVFAGIEQSPGSAASVGAGNVDGQGSAARFNFPAGLAALADGSLLVGDATNNVVRKISSGGLVSTLPATFGAKPGPYSGTSYVALDEQGTLFVTGSNPVGLNPVYAFSPAGQVRVHVQFLDATTSLATGPGGKLYVGMQGSIAVINADGSQGKTITGTSCSESAIAVKGPVLYLACPGGHTVRSIDAQGVSVIVAGQQSKPGNVDGVVGTSRLESPSAVAVDPGGNLYIADASTIRRMTPDGDVRTIAVTASPAAPDRVRGLAWSGGMLYATVAHAVLKIGPVN